MKNKMHTIKYITLYTLAVFVTGFNIYAIGLYYVNQTVVKSCNMHSTLTLEECIYNEAQHNPIYKAYKG